MTFSNCKKSGCKKKAVFFKDYCLEHSKDQKALCEEIYSFIKKAKQIIGYNFSYIPFDNIDLSNKDLSFSIFSRCSMKGANFTNSKMFSTFFDFADLSEADLTKTSAHFSIFGGASLKKANLFETSVIFSNFLGTQLEETIFKNTDLSYSRFINNKIKTISFNNCNLTKTFLQEAILDDVSLKTSNCQDAIMINCKGKNSKIEDFLL